MLSFYRTRSYTFMRKKVTGFNGKKVKKRMSRRGSHWPLVAGVITRFDIKPLAFLNLTTIVAVCFRYASLCISRPGVAVFF